MARKTDPPPMYTGMGAQYNLKRLLKPPKTSKGKPRKMKKAKTRDVGKLTDPLQPSDFIGLGKPGPYASKRNNSNNQPSYKDLFGLPSMKKDKKDKKDKKSTGSTTNLPLFAQNAKRAQEKNKTGPYASKKNTSEEALFPMYEDDPDEFNKRLFPSINGGETRAGGTGSAGSGGNNNNGGEGFSFNKNFAEMSPYINTAAQLALSKKAPKVPEPRLAKAAELDTEIDVSDQVEATKQAEMRNRRAVSNNARTSGQNIGGQTSVGITAMQNLNKIYGQKERGETQLENREAMNKQQVYNKNQGVLSANDNMKMSRASEMVRAQSEALNRLNQEVQMDNREKNRIERDLTIAKLMSIPADARGITDEDRNALLNSIRTGEELTDKQEKQFYKMTGRRIEDLTEKERKALGID